MGLGKSKQPEVLPSPATVGVPAALCAYYKAKILPLEKRQDYEFFDGPYLEDAEFSSKPSVLFLGQYSVGKTTVIRYLVGEDIPGIRIGPEPTTDTFTFVMYSDSSRIIPGTSLMAEANFGFKGLAKFGAPFLNKCNAATCPSAILKQMVFIDTPGILSGEKQRVSRGYDFEQIVSFLAEKVDRILLLFDAYKLDISDEFKRTILALQGNEEKVKIILNKVDSVEPSSLNRVNGALMWSLGKVLKCPEVPRLFTGSFWDRPIKYPQYRELFESDTKALFDDLRSLPRTVDVRRINDVVKRARQVKIFTFLMHEIVQYIGCCSQEGRKTLAINHLDTTIYARVSLHHRVPMADLPSPVELKKKLTESNHKTWKKLDKETKLLLAKLDEFLSKDVTALLSALPSDAQAGTIETGLLGTDSQLFHAEHEAEMQWATVVDQAAKHNWEQKFNNLKPVDGKLHSTNAKAHMEKCGLPSVILAQVWRLIDIDKDNKISLEEFYLMNYIINRHVAGKPIPRQLPQSLLPPGASAAESFGVPNQSLQQKAKSSKSNKSRGV